MNVWNALQTSLRVGEELSLNDSAWRGSAHLAVRLLIGEVLTDEREGEWRGDESMRRNLKPRGRILSDTGERHLGLNGGRRSQRVVRFDAGSRRDEFRSK